MYFKHFANATVSALTLTTAVPLRGGVHNSTSTHNITISHNGTSAHNMTAAHNVTVPHNATSAYNMTAAHNMIKYVNATDIYVIRARESGVELKTFLLRGPGEECTQAGVANNYFCRHWVDAIVANGLVSDVLALRDSGRFSFLPDKVFSDIESKEARKSEKQNGQVKGEFAAYLKKGLKSSS